MTSFSENFKNTNHSQPAVRQGYQAKLTSHFTKPLADSLTQGLKPLRRLAKAARFSTRFIRVLISAFVTAGALLLAVSATAQTAKPAPIVLVVGDSLSAEYGLKRGTGWVPLLSEKMALEKPALSVVNASISGDTTSGGRSRLNALLLQHQPAVVVIELGGNDALRGLPLDMTTKNLTAMTQAAKKSGAKVLLVGMQVPPNYGSAYSADFAALFGRVASAQKAALVPFLLKGIADTDDYAARFQADRIHPNEAQQPAMLANVWPELERLLP